MSTRDPDRATWKAIADELGVSIRTVRGIHDRAIRKLQVRAEELGYTADNLLADTPPREVLDVATVVLGDNLFRDSRDLELEIQGPKYDESNNPFYNRNQKRKQEVV